MKKKHEIEFPTFFTFGYFPLETFLPNLPSIWAKSRIYPKGKYFFFWRKPKAWKVHVCNYVAHFSSLLLTKGRGSICALPFHVSN
jgi:hypothetical protein